MTTMTMPRGAAPVFGILILVVAVCAIIALAAVESVVTETSHAVAKHGSALATHARQCSSDNQVFQVWRSPVRRNFAEVCDLNGYDMMDRDKTWTIRIINSSTGEEVTVFRHTGDLLSLEDYLVDQLYVLL